MLGEEDYAVGSVEKERRGLYLGKIRFMCTRNKNLLTKFSYIPIVQKKSWYILFMLLVVGDPLLCKADDIWFKWLLSQE